MLFPALVVHLERNGVKMDSASVAPISTFSFTTRVWSRFSIDARLSIYKAPLPRSLSSRAALTLQQFRLHQCPVRRKVVGTLTVDVKTASRRGSSAKYF